jgi:hypothetical protein
MRVNDCRRGEGKIHNHGTQVPKLHAKTRPKGLHCTEERARFGEISFFLPIFPLQHTFMGCVTKNSHTVSLLDDSVHIITGRHICSATTRPAVDQTCVSVLHYNLNVSHIKNWVPLSLPIGTKRVMTKAAHTQAGVGIVFGGFQGDSVYVHDLLVGGPAERGGMVRSKKKTPEMFVIVTLLERERVHHVSHHSWLARIVSPS